LGPPDNDFFDPLPKQQPCPPDIRKILLIFFLLSEIFPLKVLLISPRHSLLYFQKGCRFHFPPGYRTPLPVLTYNSFFLPPLCHLTGYPDTSPPPTYKPAIPFFPEFPAPQTPCNIFLVANLRPWPFCNYSFWPRCSFSGLLKPFFLPPHSFTCYFSRFFEPCDPIPYFLPN